MDESPESLRVESAPSSFDPGVYPGVPEAEAAALVVRYQGGEPEALATLHERLTPAILSFLRRHRGSELPPTLTWQDLRQQSWVILAELAARWRPGGSFLAYFFQSFPREISRFVRRSYTIRRTRTVQVAMVPHDDLLLQMDRLVDHTPTPEESLPLLEDLVELSPPQRAAFLLHVLDGLDFAAIGEALQVSRATAHRLHQQALRQLRANPRLQRPACADDRPSRRGSGGGGSDVERLVWALHGLAGPGGALPGRRRAVETTGLTRPAYGALISRLEAAGAIADRAPLRAGRFVDPTPLATLSRLYDGERDAAALLAVDGGDERIAGGGRRGEQ